MITIFKEYLKYLKNNPQGYWFKAKLYGWGWTPAKWQGWLVSFIFTGLIVLNFYRIDSVSHSESDKLTSLIPQTAVLVLVLIFICWKTGEKPRWQWGPPKNDK